MLIIFFLQFFLFQFFIIYLFYEMQIYGINSKNQNFILSKLYLYIG